MVRHIVDSDQFVFLRGDDARDVFLEFVVMLWVNQTLPAFHGEYHVNINLRVGVGHAAEDAAPDGAWKSYSSRFLQRGRAYGATAAAGLTFGEDLLILSSVRSEIFVERNKK